MIQGPFDLPPAPPIPMISGGTADVSKIHPSYENLTAGLMDVQRDEVLNRWHKNPILEFAKGSYHNIASNLSLHHALDTVEHALKANRLEMDDVKRAEMLLYVDDLRTQFEKGLLEREDVRKAIWRSRMHILIANGAPMVFGLVVGGVLFAINPPLAGFWAFEENPITGNTVGNISSLLCRGAVVLWLEHAAAGVLKGQHFINALKHVPPVAATNVGHFALADIPELKHLIDMQRLLSAQEFKRVITPLVHPVQAMRHPVRREA